MPPDDFSGATPEVSLRLLLTNEVPEMLGVVLSGNIMLVKYLLYTYSLLLLPPSTSDIV